MLVIEPQIKKEFPKFVEKFDIENESKYSTLLNFIEINNKGTEPSKQMLSIVKFTFKNLPTDKISPESIKDIENLFTLINSAKKSLDKFLDIFQELTMYGNSLVLDNPTVKIIQSNVTQSINYLSFMSDYFNLAIECYYSKLSLKKSTPMSFDDMFNNLSA